MNEGLEAYERYLLDDKGNKPGSVEDTVYRLGAFFPDGEVLLRDLTHVDVRQVLRCASDPKDP